MQVVLNVKLAMFKKFQYSGFTLMEAMVAALVFSIAVAGIFASMAGVQNQKNQISDATVGAALCGQQFLEKKRAAVDGRDWNSGALAITAGQVGAGTCSNGGVIYTMNYNISNVTGTSARKGTVTVTW